METIHSIQGYDKIGVVGSHDFSRRRARRRLVILATSAAVAIAIAAAVAVFVLAGIKGHDNVVIAHVHHAVVSPPPRPSSTVQAVCNLTRFVDRCLSTLTSPNATAAASDPEKLLNVSLSFALDAFVRVETLPRQLLSVTTDPVVRSALSVCSLVFSDAVGMINASLARMAPGRDGVMLNPSKISDIRTWLSSALTDATTCLDSFYQVGVIGQVCDSIAAALKNATELTSNGLAGSSWLQWRIRIHGIPHSGRHQR